MGPFFRWRYVSPLAPNHLSPLSELPCKFRELRLLSEQQTAIVVVQRVEKSFVDSTPAEPCDFVPTIQKGSTYRTCNVCVAEDYNLHREAV